MRKSVRFFQGFAHVGTGAELQTRCSSGVNGTGYHKEIETDWMTLFKCSANKPPMKESGHSVSELRHFERERVVAARIRYHEDPTPENEAALTDTLDRFASLVLRSE